jgi:Putative mono-oxygenase ydhR
MITALVLYDLPANIDREACRQHFLKIAPDFLDVPGFVRKQFIHDVNGGVAGGSYIWETLADAKAFYSGTWLDGIRARYGCEPRVTYFETFAVADQATHYAGPPPGPFVRAMDRVE